MHRTLSARYTALLKFLVPPIWIGLAGYAVWRVWSDASPLALKGLLVALVVASLLVLLAFVVPLKRVRLADEGLHISNYRREVTVPFRAVAGVRQDWLPTFRLITLELRDAAPGRRVIFMPSGPPRMAFWRADYWREDELVGELRRLAGLTP